MRNRGIYTFCLNYAGTMYNLNDIHIYFCLKFAHCFITRVQHFLTFEGHSPNFAMMTKNN